MRNTPMRSVILALGLVATLALAQSTLQISPNANYTITSYPLYATLVTPDDDNDLAVPGQVRADSAGTAVVVCVGNADDEEVTLELVAGEFAPCVVRRVHLTGTDVATLHVFY